MLLKKVETYIAQHQLLLPQATVLVACSGGADSVALLHVLMQLGYTCVALHCNFHLRQEESNRDQAFVESLCKTWNCACHVTHFDTQHYAKNHKIGIELAARELRYTWFEEQRQATGAQAIAVAHHQDDNIETSLLHLIRGTGIQGLTGMKPQNGYIIRPFLGITRADIEQYLQDNGTAYVTDSTNLQTDYTRNKIRHQLIPLLQEINPSFCQVMPTNIQNFRATERIYARYVAQQKKIWYQEKEDEIIINLTGLKEQLEAETLLFEWIKDFKIHPAEVGKILHAQTGKRFENKHCIMQVKRSPVKGYKMLIITKL
ncbi:MAG: tRNA lysidine(34) synthetase TilS [Paludibacteraceae bacterium]|jgi:tRNA(Ile)-lysidine synthase|nr:tRNA lysidine(34) synthetase TilS [Paludibacteraceae bacterium]